MDPTATTQKWTEESNISHILWKRNYWQPKIVFLSKCRTVKWLYIVNLVKSLSLYISSVEQLCTTSVKLKALARTKKHELIIWLNKQTLGFFTVAMFKILFSIISSKFTEVSTLVWIQLVSRSHQPAPSLWILCSTDTGGCMHKQVNKSTLN